MSTPAAALSDDFPMLMEIEVDQNTSATMQNCPPVTVAFGLYPLLDKKATKAAGHDVYKDAEFVKIAIPGDRNSLYFQPADDRQRKRFPKAYDAFKRRGTHPVEGMPIEQWAVISRSVAMTLRAAHIQTVESLAAVHDGHIDKLGFNARELRGKAQAWLAQAKDGAATMALAEEKKALQDQLDAMRAQIAALNTRVGPQDQIDLSKPVKPPVAGPSEADVEADVVAAARRPRARKAS